MVELAVAAIRSRLGVDRLNELCFLDAGSGSGLLSLAARILGARVHSFDNEFVFQRVRRPACTTTCLQIRAARGRREI